MRRGDKRQGKGKGSDTANYRNLTKQFPAKRKSFYLIFIWKKEKGSGLGVGHRKGALEGEADPGTSLSPAPLLGTPAALLHWPGPARAKVQPQKHIQPLGGISHFIKGREVGLLLYNQATLGSGKTRDPSLNDGGGNWGHVGADSWPLSPAFWNFRTLGVRDLRGTELWAERPRRARRTWILPAHWVQQPGGHERMDGWAV